MSAIDREIAGALQSVLMKAQALGLGPLVCLLVVAAEEGLSISELADQLKWPQQSVSRYISILLGRYESVLTSTEFEPLIEQRINAQDPRKRSLYLSAAGTSFVMGLMERFTRVSGEAE